MEDKKAINILIGLQEKYSLTAEEKEAVLTAIGVLSWTSLGESRMKRIIKSYKAKRDLPR